MKIAYKDRAKSSLIFLKFNHLTIRGFLVIIVLLSLLQLFVSNRFVTEGEKIKTAEAQAESLQAENLKLQNRIQQLSSLSYLQNKATEMGFVKIDKVRYLDEPISVASR